MNFREHFTLIKEAVENENLEFLIHIKFYPPAFDKLKAKPGYTSMVKDEKEKVFFAAATTLNNYPFKSGRGAFSEGRMEIKTDTDELKSEEIPFIDMYIIGVEITSDVIKNLYEKLHTYRPHLVSTVTYENLFKRKLNPDTAQKFEELIDEL